MGQPVQPKPYSSSVHQASPEAEGSDYSDWENLEEDLSVDSFTDDAADYESISARDRLTQLTEQARAGNLTAERRQKVLDELHELELELQRIGTVDNAAEEEAYESVQEKLGTMETNLAAGHGNFAKLHAFDEELKKLQQDVEKNKHIPEEERKELLGQIEEFRQQALEGFSFDPEFAEEDLQAIRDRLAATGAFTTEAERTKGFADAIAANLDALFQTSPVVVQDSTVMGALWGGISGAGAGGATALALNGLKLGTGATLGVSLAGGATMAGIGLVGGVLVGAAVGEKQGAAFAQGSTIGTVGGAAIGAIAAGVFTAGLGAVAGAKVGAVIGSVVGGTIGAALSEAEGPKSGLKNLPDPGRNLDLIMKKQSGLANSKAPGEIVRALYDTSLSSEEQQQKIQDFLRALPPGAQSYALSAVVNLIATQDARKLAFLKDKTPALHEYLVQSIQAGQTSIQTGQAGSPGSSDGYSVRFDGANYQVTNEDTSLLRNDWNGYTIHTAQMTQPMTNALNILNGGFTA